MPKALEHVSDTPISDLKTGESPFRKEAVTHEPPEVILQLQPADVQRLRRVMFADVEKSHGMQDTRLKCVGWPKAGMP